MKKTYFYVWSVMITILLCLSFTSSASAMVRYSYTGNNFTIANAPYTTSMSLTGWFEMNSPIPPNTSWPTDFSGTINNYSFFDGVNTLTNTNSGFLSVYFATDALGNITNWEFKLTSPVPAAINSLVDIITTTYTVDAVDTDTNCVQVSNGICDGVSQINGASNSNPGTWTMQIIPAMGVPTMNEWGMMIFMVLAGFGCVYYLRRHRRAQR